MSGESNNPGVITFHAFVWQLKCHYPVDRADNIFARWTTSFGLSGSELLGEFVDNFSH